MQLIVNMSGETTISREGEKSVVCKLALTDLMNYFKEGLIARFTKTAR